jgi:hypothetical protein
LKVESAEGLAVGSWRTAAGRAETKRPRVTGNEWLVTGEERKKEKADSPSLQRSFYFLPSSGKYEFTADP